MKKFIVAAMMCCIAAGAAFADLNVKAGFDFLGTGTMKDGGDKTAFGTKPSASFAVEYMYPVHDMIKVGAGVEYMLPRSVNMSGGGEDIKFSALPVYLSVQANPLSAKEVYFKGNIGYVAYTDVNIDDSGAPDISADGSVYMGLGFGYDFDFGLFFEALYGAYFAKLADDFDQDVCYQKAGLNVGYKFKI